MFAFITAVHIVVCVIMIVVILLQEGKEGMGAIGGGVGATAFGPRARPTPLSRITVVAAVLFMGTAILLAWMSGQGHSVVGNGTSSTSAATAPAKTGKAAATTPGAAKAGGMAAPAKGAAKAPAAPAKGAAKAPAAPAKAAAKAPAKAPPKAAEPPAPKPGK